MHNQLLSFLSALFSTAPKNSFIEFAIKTDQRISRYFPVSQLPELAGQNAEALWWNCTTPGTALFFGAHPRESANRSNSDVVAFCSLIADVDEKHKENWKALPGKLKVLSKQGVPPTAVIKSGHGVHLYWFLHEAEPTYGSKGSPSHARSVMFRLQKYLGSDAVHDPARILRMPMSTNWKDGKAIHTSIEKFNPKSKRYTSTEIDAALSSAKVPYWNLPPSITKSSEGNHRGATERTMYLGLAKLTPGRLKKLKLPPLPDRILDLIERGHYDGDGYLSRSEAELAVMNALYRAGVSLEQAKRIFAASPIGERAREQGEGLVARNYTLAKKFVTPGCVVVRGVVKQVFADHLMEFGGQAEGTRVRLVMQVAGDEELAGREVVDRVFVPDAVRPWAQLRWRAIWQAVGRQPPKDSSVRELLGSEVALEVREMGAKLVVMNYLPRACA